MAVGRRPRLVVLRALGLGDLLTAVPALRALARAFPGHERLLVAPAALEPLVRVLGGAVDRLVPAGALEPLAPELHGSEVAVNLHGRGPQSHRLLLDAGAERLLWFEHDEVQESRGAPRWRAGEYEPERWCRLLTEYGVAADPGELDIEPPAGEPPPGAAGATLIHPGAASVSRRWPPERFAAVAREEISSGRAVAITGGPAEVPLAREVAALAGSDRVAVLAGRTDLAELASAVAGAERVLCGDTGVAHLATALGTPSVVLFGPSAPSEWGPPAGRTRHRVLWSGRRGDPHAQEPDPGLLEIEPADVLVALDALPRRRQLVLD